MDLSVPLAAALDRILGQPLCPALRDFGLSAARALRLSGSDRWQGTTGRGLTGATAWQNGGRTMAELTTGVSWIGVIVGAVAGMGSINNAIDNSVPAVKAMNTAYEMAVDQGHTELADQIKKDISAVKVRLDSGRDLNFVKAMQDKYSKFIQTEGLTYESKLAVMLEQRIK